MGIKNLYDEIGPGERISLARLAIEKFETTGRPFRLAIDASIWQIQAQSGKGGKNPALRTLFYRLRRLLCHSIQPVLVFDGPNRPAFKRGRRTVANPASYANIQAKQLLNLLGVPHHDAPGEAEAECALLQRAGLVDAVLTEDVDALMFGCGLTLRQWSPEGRGKVPTHVNLYDINKCGLTPKAMLLVALMSGGDYNPAGIPKCGVKIACEAARAGFGESLCEIPMKDASRTRAWRDKLNHELHTNESGFFSCKHKSLRIPEDFPDKTILGYYLSPTVSSASEIDILRTKLQWRDVDVPRLRAFVAQNFDWITRAGAKKLIRAIAEPLLLRGLVTGSRSERDDSDVVQAVSGRRVHFSTDGKPELRVSYVPLDLVPIDLNAEEENVAKEKVGGEERIAESSSSGETSEDAATLADKETGVRRRRASRFDPAQPQQFWLPEVFVRCGAPLAVDVWEEKESHLAKLASEKAAEKLRKTTARARKKTGGMKEGALDPYVRVEKPRASQPRGAENRRHALPSVRNDTGASAMAFSAPLSHDIFDCPSSRTRPETEQAEPSNQRKGKTTQKTCHAFPDDEGARGRQSMKPAPAEGIAPWTLSQRPSQAFDSADESDECLPELLLHGQSSPRTKYQNSAHPGPATSEQGLSTGMSSEPIFISSSPSAPEDELPRQAVVERTAPGDTGSSNARPHAAKGAKRAVALRDSLEGAWKEVPVAGLAATTSSGSASQARVWSEVDVIDLT